MLSGTIVCCLFFCILNFLFTEHSIHETTIYSSHAYAANSCRVCTNIG